MDVRELHGTAVVGARLEDAGSSPPASASSSPTVATQPCAGFEDPVKLYEVRWEP